MDNTVECGHVYNHYKGGQYIPLYIARHTETGEILVVYKNIYDDTKIWARPLTMWNECVAEGVPRFRLIDG